MLDHPSLVRTHPPTLRAGAVGSGQAASALADFLRGVELLAASEALRIGQRFGLDPKALINIGQALSGIDPAMAGILRAQVLTRRFDSGLALGQLLKGLDTASVLARAGQLRRRCLPPAALRGRRLRTVSARGPIRRR